MHLTYKENVFRELRMFIADGQENEITDASLAGAVTLNADLASLGFVMSPESVAVMAAHQADMGRFYRELKEYAGEVKADPMYPGFPDEVMNMDEAEYRLHQLCHYFSTYGIEDIFGVSVSRGWLPHDADEKDSREEKTGAGFIAGLKQITVIPENDAYIVPAETILSRGLRMANAEEDIIAEALPHIDADRIAGFRIPFKENLEIAFAVLVDTGRMDAARAICQHPGDVFKCMPHYLESHGYRLRTRQKKAIVRLLESYPVAGFRENLMLSNRKREKVLNILRFLSYRKYSRSRAHLEAVIALRNDELRSWMGMVEELIDEDVRNNALGVVMKDGEPEYIEGKAVPFIVQRPGMMLRMLRRLIRIGYMPELLAAALSAHADELSTKTIVDCLTKADMTDDLNPVMTGILRPILAEKLASIETPLKGKKVYVDEGGYDLSQSVVSKSEEGGYVRSGLAYRIPDDVRRVRFFVYWNDSRRVDIDLHSFAETPDGEPIHIGWYGDFRNHGMVMSGDITHSDAAEYIDIDLEKCDAAAIESTIEIFSGKPSFRDVDEVLVGMMGVSKLGEDVSLYSPSACFFSHKLVSDERRLLYGYILPKERVIRYIGRSEKRREEWLLPDIMFSVSDYVDMLLESQEAQSVSSPEEADIVLSVAGGGNVSLIDENYFLDE